MNPDVIGQGLGYTLGPEKLQNFYFEMDAFFWFCNYVFVPNRYNLQL